MNNLYQSKLSNTQKSDSTTYIWCPCKGSCFLGCSGKCTGTCSGSCAGNCASSAYIGLEG